MKSCCKKNQYDQWICDECNTIINGNSGVNEFHWGNALYAYVVELHEYVNMAEYLKYIYSSHADHQPPS